MTKKSGWVRAASKKSNKDATATDSYGRNRAHFHVLGIEKA